MRLPANCASHDIPDGKHPLLLSQSVQACLGMKKDVRAGTIQLSDYEDHHVEVARQAKTGLFMIRSDHSDPKIS